MPISDAEAKRLNLSMPVANDVKLGDVIKKLQEAFGGEITVTWDDVTEKPKEFPPASHKHAITDVNQLQAKLDDFEQRISTLENADGGS